MLVEVSCLHISTNNGKIISSKYFTPVSSAHRSVLLSPIPKVRTTTTVKSTLGCRSQLFRRCIG